MSKRVYVVIGINTDHWVRDVKQVFAERTDAEEYCEQAINDHYTDIVESEHTRQKDDYLWTNDVDDWGYVIESARFDAGENR